MKKFLLRILVLLLICTTFVHLSLLFVDEVGWGNDTFALKYKNYETVKDSINTIFLGSSKMNSHIDPYYFDELLKEENIHSYNLGAPYTHTPENYYLYDQFLAENNPTVKYVFLELNSLHIPEWNRIRTKRSFYWQNFKVLKFASKYVLRSNYSIQKKLAIPALYSVSYLSKHFSLAHFSPQKSKVYCTGSLRKGFCPMKKEEGFLLGLDFQRSLAAQGYNQTNLEPYLNEYHLEYIEGLIQLSKNKGIHLVFLISPRGAFQYPEILALKEKIPVNHLIDLGSPEIYPKFYVQEYSVDGAHLTETGARMFTKILTEKFKKKCLY